MADTSPKRLVKAKPKNARTKKQQDIDSAPVPEVKYVDMTPENRERAVNIAKLAYVAKTKGEIAHWTDCAEMIQSEFNDVTGNWHCIVGQNFGSFVSHEAGHMFFFYIGHMGVLLYRHG